MVESRARRASLRRLVFGWFRCAINSWLARCCPFPVRTDAQAGMRNYLREAAAVEWLGCDVEVAAGYSVIPERCCVWILPWLALACLALACLGLPCLALPCLALPCLASALHVGICLAQHQQLTATAFVSTPCRLALACRGSSASTRKGGGGGGDGSGGGSSGSHRRCRRGGRDGRHSRPGVRQPQVPATVPPEVPLRLAAGAADQPDFFRHHLRAVPLLLRPHQR